MEQRGQLFFLGNFLIDFSVQSTYLCLKLHIDEILVDESKIRCLLLQCILYLATVKMTSQTQGFSFPFTVPKSYIFFETVFFPIILSLKDLIKHIDINKAYKAKNQNQWVLYWNNHAMWYKVYTPIWKLCEGCEIWSSLNHPMAKYLYCFIERDCLFWKSNGWSWIFSF